MSDGDETMDHTEFERVALAGAVWVPTGAQFKIMLDEERTLARAREAHADWSREDEVEK